MLLLIIPWLVTSIWAEEDPWSRDWSAEEDARDWCVIEGSRDRDWSAEEDS